MLTNESPTMADVVEAYASGPVRGGRGTDPGDGCDGSTRPGFGVAWRAPRPAAAQAGEASEPAAMLQLLQATLDVLGIAVLVVDPGMALSHANRIGKALLEQGDGLTVRAGRVSAALPEETRRLDRLIDRVCARDPDVRGVGAVLVSRPSHRRAFSVFAVPLCDAPTGQAAACPRAVLFVTDPGKPCCGASELVARSYALTDAERRVALAVAGGVPPKRIASQHGVAVNTIKSHLRSAFAKLGVSRQVDLARILLAVPPIREPSER